MEGDSEELAVKANTTPNHHGCPANWAHPFSKVIY